MESTLYSDLVNEKSLLRVAEYKISLLDGERKKKKRYYHREMLKKRFSIDMKWSSLTSNGVTVAADIVTLDSSLPLKKRASLGKFSGDIPKSGMKMTLSEQQMSDIMYLKATNQGREVAKVVFKDVGTVTEGIWERSEYQFLELLSTGSVLIKGEKDTSTGVRLTYPVKDDRKIQAPVNWESPTAKIIDDIEDVINKAGDLGFSIGVISMSKKTFRNLKNNTQVKNYFASNKGFAGDVSLIKRLTEDDLKAFFSDELNVVVNVIDRSVNTEKNGVTTINRPFSDEHVVFHPTMNVGGLVYSKLVEESTKAKQVTYAKVDDMILISKYHKNDPIREYTSSQAIVIPVLDDIDSIFYLNIGNDESQGATQTEGDANINIFGADYSKQIVVDTLVDLGVSAKIDMKDSTIVRKVNDLNEEETESLRTALGI